MKNKSYYSIYKKLLILIAVLIFYLGTSFSRDIYSSDTADDIIYLIIIFTISLFCNVNAMLVAGEQMCKEKEELNRIQITAYTDNEKEEYKNIPNADTAFQETFSRETEYQRDLVYTEIKSAKKNCYYDCLMSRHKLDAPLLSELEKLGYEIIRNEDYVTISWDKKDVRDETV